MLIKTEYLNLLHPCDFLCFNVMNISRKHNVTCQRGRCAKVISQNLNLPGCYCTRQIYSQKKYCIEDRWQRGADIK